LISLTYREFGDGASAGNLGGVAVVCRSLQTEPAPWALSFRSPGNGISETSDRPEIQTQRSGCSRPSAKECIALARGLITFFLCLEICHSGIAKVKAKTAPKAGEEGRGCSSSVLCAPLVPTRRGKFHLVCAPLIYGRPVCFTGPGCQGYTGGSKGHQRAEVRKGRAVEERAANWKPTAPYSSFCGPFASLGQGVRGFWGEPEVAPGVERRCFVLFRFRVRLFHRTGVSEVHGGAPRGGGQRSAVGEQTTDCRGTALHSLVCGPLASLDRGVGRA
jgi:hypothetical protein